MNNYLALSQTDLGTGVVNGLGSLSDTSDVFASFDNAVSFFVGILTLIASLWFLFILITGGLSYMTAGDDKGRLEDARQRITLGLVGLTVIVSAVFLIGLFAYLLGIDFLNPGSLLEGLAP
jgi:hypothetical protein